MQLTDYHAKYYAHELTKRCSSDSLEKLAASLADAQVDLNPHQVDAALFAFRSPLSRGALLADEVGLGKTIEAGIILSQIWAERKRKILIIVPSSLRKQWNQELLEKFFLPSQILEAKSFNQYLKNVGALHGEPVGAVREPPLHEIPLGLYRMGRHVEDGHIFRIGHPLAQQIMDDAGNKKLPNAEIAFDYSGHTLKISIMEPLVGTSGYLSLAKLSVESFEEEDHLIFSAVTDAGTILDDEQAQRLFSLPGTCKGGSRTAPTKICDRLQQIFEVGKGRVIEVIGTRNSVFFDDEMEKLEKWADDLKSGLEYELKELDREIKYLKTESKKILKLDDKLQAQKEIKELEKKRNTKRRTLFEAQDEIDSRKEGLIEGVEARLRQQISTNELFAIRWRVQ